MPRYPSQGSYYSGGDRIGDLLNQRAQMAGQVQDDPWARNLPAIIGQLGQGVQGFFQARQERKAAEEEKARQTRQSAAFDEAISTGDYKRIFTILPPDKAASVVNAIRAMTPDGAKKYRDRAELLRDVARGVEDSPEPSRPGAWKMSVGQLVKDGVLTPEEAEPYAEYDPGVSRSVAGFGKQPEKGKGLHEVSAGASLYNPETKQVEFTAPTVKAERTAQVGSFEDYVTRRFGDNPKPEQITQARKEYAQADNQGTGTGLSPGMESNIVNRLTTQWDKASAPVRELDRQARLMNTGLEAAKAGDLAAGSQAVLVTFQKILDPTSVVRESEYARSAAGQSLLSRIQGAAEKLAKGGAGIPVSELEKYKALADQMVKNAGGEYLSNVKERLGRTADRYKIPRDIVFEDVNLGAGGGGTTPPPVAGPPKKFDTKAEFDAAPPGTLFIAPDGTTRRKP